MSDPLSPSEALVRELYRISADYAAGFEDQLDRLLRAGCERLELELGIVARVEEQDYTVLRARSPEDAVAPGAKFRLSDTYCEATLRAAGPVGFECAGESEWHTHPAYAAFKLESYLGTPIRVADRAWGTLNFSSFASRPRKWAPRDLDSIQLMAAWIGAELQRQQIEQELRAALAQVKTLEGLLPICAACKKIREQGEDGSTAWTQVETYVTRRTHAVFSHGMCPDCAEEWLAT